MSGLMKISIISLLMISIGLAWFGCGPKQDNKIPITTNSKEAKELFLKGRDLAERLRGQDSRQYFEKAVEKDPNFALAYLNLAQVQPTNKGFFEVLNNATALVDKVYQGERWMILGFQAIVNADPVQQREGDRNPLGDPHCAFDIYLH